MYYIINPNIMLYLRCNSVKITEPKATRTLSLEIILLKECRFVLFQSLDYLQTLSVLRNRHNIEDKFEYTL